VTFLNDLRFAFRQLRRNPGFAVVAVLTLALGMGANAAIFSVVDGVLLRRTPVNELERLVVIWETDRASGTTREPASVPDFLDFRERAREVDTIASFRGAEVTFGLGGAEPRRLAALGVTHDFLPLLGVRPILGRGFTAEEDRAGGPKVALISEALWEEALARDPEIVGRTILLDEAPFTIVGVAPSAAAFGVPQILSAAAYARGFVDRGDARVDIWVPLAPDPETSPRSTHPILLVGRLAAWATLASSRQELAGIAAELERVYPENEARGVQVEALGDVVFGPVRPALLALLATVAVVLLVACANVANLLLARGTARRREVAVRLALGAGAGRLARQFLVENLLLTLLAGMVGLGFARAGLVTLLALAPATVPRLDEIGVDFRVLGVTLLASLAVGLVFGLIPVLQFRKVDLQNGLKGEGSSVAVAGERLGAGSALVVAEFALAVVLVVGAGLLVRSFWRLLQVEPGFRAEGVLKAQYQLPRARYPVDFAKWPNWVEAHGFNDALLERMTALPGVKSASIAGNHPLDQGFTNSFVVIGREQEARDWPEISVRRVTPEYFSTVGVPLLRGRPFGRADGSASRPVAVVNRAAERRFFRDQEALGQEVAFWGARRLIVGIVGDEKFHGLTEEAPLAVYLPLAQAPSANGGYALLTRTDGDPSALAPEVRVAVRAIDPALAVYGVEPMEDTLAQSVGGQRFTTLVVGLFAALALLLAAIGTHGVLSYTLAQRTREIGVRVALGARPGKVLGLMVWQGLRLTLAGLALGLGAAWAVTRLAQSLLFGVTPTDPLTFATVPLVLTAVALLASYLPARRATRIDPARALRAE
jgi:putative ABC transport system permease protein